MTFPMIDVGGARLRYRIDGDRAAPPLVLSNSLGTDLSMWDPQMPELAQRFRVVRYDTRGHGQSDVTSGPYRIEQLARDVLGLLDALGIERADFCGLSMGGMIGMWLGVHAGYRITRLVLANTSAHMPPPEMWNTRIEKVREGGMDAIVPAVLERWFTPQFIARDPAAVAATGGMLQRIVPEGYIAACCAVRDMDQRADITEITRPTLVIAGTHDAATPSSHARLLVDSIAGAQYVELAASHLSNVEAAPQFNQALLDFLQP